MSNHSQNYQLWLTEKSTEDAGGTAVNADFGDAVEANASVGIHLLGAGSGYNMPCYRPRSINERIVPCGKCAGCIALRRDSWTFRLMEEWKSSLSSRFLTLTYNDESLPRNEYGAILFKPHFQNFMKRLRHKEQHKLTYYAVGEYGDKFKRPHYHAILFNSLVPQSEMADIWKMGNVHNGDVNLESIHYVTGYVIHKLQNHDKRLPNPFSLMSKGLGLDYIKKSNREAEKHHRRQMDNVVVLPGGVKGMLPRYYRDKIFTPEERSLIADKKELIAKQRLKDWTYNQFREEEQVKMLKLLKRKEL